METTKIPNVGQQQTPEFNPELRMKELKEQLQTALSEGNFNEVAKKAAEISSLEEIIAIRQVVQETSLKMKDVLEKISDSIRAIHAVKVNGEWQVDVQVTPAKAPATHPHSPTPAPVTAQRAVADDSEKERRWNAIVGMTLILPKGLGKVRVLGINRGIIEETGEEVNDVRKWLMRRIGRGTCNIYTECRVQKNDGRIVPWSSLY